MSRAEKLRKAEESLLYLDQKYGITKNSPEEDMQSCNCATVVGRTRNALDPRLPRS